MNRKVLAVVAHPDDEVLGCGGALRRHADEGDDVSIYILADGEASRSSSAADDVAAAIQARGEAAVRAGGILGASHVSLDNFPDNRLDSVDRLDLVKKVEAHIRDTGPGIIYTHHSGDLNIDHRRVHEAVVTACRPQPECTVKTLLFFEVASSTEWQVPSGNNPFAPNWFVNITSVLGAKLRALDEYRDEMRPWPHPRSPKGVEYLARWRGATVGVEAAEAFVLGRNLY